MYKNCEIDHNKRNIDHNKRKNCNALVLHGTVPSHFDHTKRLITLTVIILSGVYCTSKTRPTRFLQTTSKIKHKDSLRFFRIASKTKQTCTWDSLKLFQKPDIRSPGNSFELLQNQIHKIPEILLNYFENQAQVISKIL